MNYRIVLLWISWFLSSIHTRRAIGDRSSAGCSRNGQNYPVPRSKGRFCIGNLIAFKTSVRI